MVRFVSLAIALAATLAGSGMAEFTGSGELRFPANYREWVFLSSGLGMTYGPAAAASAQPLFDNVFVNPGAFAHFKQTGRWPEGATFVLEVRYSTSHGSINRGGHFQTDVAAIEVSVKDSRRFRNGWAYFNFGGGLSPLLQTATALPQDSTCQACHRPNGAVDNTFTQFYPAVLEIAKNKRTLQAGYRPHLPSPVGLFHRIRDDRAQAPQLLDAAKASDPNSAALSERSLARIGRGLLDAGKTEQAVAVLTWLTGAYPRSAGAADSLAQALQKSGQADRARQESERALQLLDADATISASARETLRQILNERLTQK